MSANRKNQYYHDVVLHHRVLKLLLSHSKTPVSQNHWLAFMAGIATTLTRVELVNDPILDDLVALFLTRVPFLLPPIFEMLDSPGFITGSSSGGSCGSWPSSTTLSSARLAMLQIA
jgi:hypothetical protein